MKYFLILAFLLLLSCSNSTDIKDNLYMGEHALKGSIQITSDNDSIGYNDFFSVFIHFQAQPYRIKGTLNLYGALGGSWTYYDGVLKSDSSLILISPLPKSADTINAGIIIDLDLFTGRDTTIIWNFKSDAIRVLNGSNKHGRGFSAFVRIDSIYLDCDTLYGGPVRPVAVTDKRWYSISNPDDFNILARQYIFLDQFYKSSSYLDIYFKKD